jgi:hypothetical protein
MLRFPTQYRWNRFKVNVSAISCLKANVTNLYRQKIVLIFNIYFWASKTNFGLDFRSPTHPGHQQRIITRALVFRLQDISQNTVG